MYVEVATAALLDGEQLIALTARLTGQTGAGDVQATAGSLGTRYSAVVRMSVPAATPGEARQHATMLLTSALADLGITAGGVIASGPADP